MIDTEQRLQLQISHSIAHEDANLVEQEVVDSVSAVL